MRQVGQLIADGIDVFDVHGEVPFREGRDFDTLRARALALPGPAPCRRFGIVRFLFAERLTMLSRSSCRGPPCSWGGPMLLDCCAAEFSISCFQLL
jgi:hypothetical protein